MTAHHKMSPHEKEGTKIYMAINMYLHINPCPVRMEAYENKI
jgi:hypothetical protein